MSALARYFNRSGVEVLGYDRSSSPITEQLREEGITISYQNPLDGLKNSLDLLVYTAAMSASNPALAWAKEQGVDAIKRSEVLGAICQNYTTLAVAGTHGKTTTTAMLAHIFHEVDDAGVNAFVGGQMANYNTNFLFNEKSNYAVVEADEFDRSFMTLHPSVSVITSLDPDHLDVYGESRNMMATFTDYADQVSQTIVLKEGLTLDRQVGADIASYGWSQTSPYRAEDVAVVDGQYRFKLVCPDGAFDEVKIGLPGRHNIENAVAASAVAHLCGLNMNAVVSALASFRGVKRRFERVVSSPNLVFVDDYAHHPTELRAAISAMHEMNSGKRITGVFQPHLFSRTRDFINDFAEALSELDELVLLDIYPAREEPIPGITSAALLELVQCDRKQLVSKAELTGVIESWNPEVLITLGAGDIDREVASIKSILTK